MLCVKWNGDPELNPVEAVAHRSFGSSKAKFCECSVEQELGSPEGCLEDSGVGTCLLLTYRESAVPADTRMAVLVLRETGAAGTDKTSSR